MNRKLKIHNKFYLKENRYKKPKESFKFLIDKRIAIRTLQHIKKINELYKKGKIKIIADNGSILIFKFI